MICGLKLTHDGAVALFDDSRLLFSVEVEKLDNNPRYCEVADLTMVERILGTFGFQPADVDQWVVDGWDGWQHGCAVTSYAGVPVHLAVAPYRERELAEDLLLPRTEGKLPIAGAEVPYTSYVHVAGHLSGAYCTSGFAELRTPSFALIWDGGLFPRLYHVDPDAGVENLGPLFPVIGHAYATAGHHFGPFRRADEARTVDDLSIAGKLMAYIALGRPDRTVLRVLQEQFEEHFDGASARATAYRQAIRGTGSNSEPSLAYVHEFFRSVRRELPPGAVSDEDVLASVHAFFERLLVDRCVERAQSLDYPTRNLVFSGGCALNIKWNSALRAAGFFDAVWVPPFPNDSGAAIGTVAAHLLATADKPALSWHVRRGMPAPRSPIPTGWTDQACSAAELAAYLYSTGPVVIIDGRAELGPRALGGRSIIAAPIDPAMKDLLNEVKDRAAYRPVAPICLVARAPEIFDPGTPDPFMLFDHLVRPDWLDRIPAVVHLDGTARLQTVSEEDDPFLHDLLVEFEALSSIPVLCNTSANFHGRGFFPDTASAMAWGRVPAVYSDGRLYLRAAGGNGQGDG